MRMGFEEAVTGFVMPNRTRRGPVEKARYFAGICRKPSNVRISMAFPVEAKDPPSKYP
jgi:hypothetical protein